MIKIKIDTENAAFEGENFGAEVARILRNIADDFAANGYSDIAYNDVNGNTVADVEN